jgi:hypothetical protein
MNLIDRKSVLTELVLVALFSVLPLYLVTRANSISLFDPNVAEYLKNGFEVEKAFFLFIIILVVSAAAIIIKRKTKILGLSKTNSFFTAIFEGSVGSIRTIINFFTGAFFIAAVVFYKADAYGLAVYIFFMAIVILIFSSGFHSMAKNIS